MKIVKNPLFYIPLAVALISYLLPYFEITLPNIITFYLNDFLCMPIVLSLCLAIMQALYANPNLLLTKKMIIAMTIFYSILFEGILPSLMSRYTYDPIDIILYLLGGYIFYKIQPKLIK